MNNSSKQIEWRSIYRLPLEYDDCGYAWSKEKDGSLIMALTFEGDYIRLDDGTLGSTGRNGHIVDIINGTASNDTDGKWTVDGCDVFDNGEYVFCVRGWGHLTGVLRLNGKAAASVQDGFAEYILSRLND